jgi:DNA polymerase III subunit gamma/tau
MASDSASPRSDASPPTSEKAGEYVVVARRYRPKSFTELVGQNQVAQALRNAILTNRVGHAYLFTGARGVGKTSTARIFAKCLNCVEGPTPTPCGQCDSCQSIASGDDVDVLEIDGASNRGIDEIRELRSNVNVRPSRAHFKVYIIDEVHMLTSAAFNALLKTLEEPPEHVKFVFCTTEANKIPITVLSRCQRFDFAPVATDEIVERLRFIVTSEGREAEDAALQLLARRAGGSMRDSQSLLEQLLSFCGDRVTEHDVHSMLGTAQSGRLATIAHHLIDRQAAGALAEVDAAVREGVDIGQLAEQLLGYFRDMMTAVVGCPADLLLHAGTADYAQLAETGRQYGIETLLAAVQILDQALARMRQTTQVRTLVEMALVRICHLERLDDLSALIANFQQGTLGAPSGGQPAARMPIATPAPRGDQKKNDQLTVSGPAPPESAARSVATQTAREEPGPDASKLDDRDSENLVRPEIPATVSSLPQPQVHEAASKSVEKVVDAPVIEATEENRGVHSADESPEWTRDLAEEQYRRAVEEIGGMASDIAGNYDSLAIPAPNVLVVGLKATYNKEWCERGDVKRKLEQTLARLAGRSIRIDFAVTEEVLPQPAARRASGRNQVQKMREIERNPLVQEAMALFDAEIVRVDEKQEA